MHLCVIQSMFVLDPVVTLVTNNCVSSVCKNVVLKPITLSIVSTDVMINMLLYTNQITHDNTFQNTLLFGILISK